MAVGHRIHRRVSAKPRQGGNYTRFFRNLPQLELLRDLAVKMSGRSPLRLAVVACSTGAELYSAVWMLRMARPGQRVRAVGIDLSEDCIQTARDGAYPLDAREVSGLSEATYRGLFTRQGDTLVVQQWLREGVSWGVGDAYSSDFAVQFGSQDVVLANNFLFHMPGERAEACLRNILRLVSPDGYLIVGGIDLDLKSRSVRQLGLIPVTTKLDEIYTAEEGMLEAWPLRFWGLEPMDPRRQDWPARYATVFRVPATVDTAGCEGSSF